MGRATRRVTHAGGAGRTGLGRLIELTAVHSAGDALVTLALAGTLLFGLPVDEARGQVALYLLITMAPFAFVAPFVGPALDRLRSGRRFVMAGTLIARGLLCWGMAAAVQHNDVVALFPAAFAVLVLSKAFNVSRAAIMPSVLPAEIPLVTANSRVGLAALVAAGVAAPLSIGLSALIGPDWVLRIAMAVFIAAGVFAVRLPRHVDAPDAEPPAPDGRGRWRTMLNLGPVVGEAMRANAALRVFSGFLLLFMLFLVQEGHLPGLDPKITLALLAAAAGLGAVFGTAVGSWFRSHAPHVIVLTTLGAATVVATVTGLTFGLVAALIVALAGAVAQSLAKVALDAIVQREIMEEVRSSTFGVSEALLQIAWVFGGLLGLGLSLLPDGTPGLLTMAVGLGGTLVLLLVRRVRRTRAGEREPRRGQAVAVPDVVPEPPQAVPEREKPTGREPRRHPVSPDAVTEPGPVAPDPSRDGHTRPLPNPTWAGNE
ncbi:MFS transporter [Rhizohabitans arisaemae]|uniref:MFS transporter n=1 Tax=Rhizohabitans arisaemae TaxID=2720610 RepID=UPI0024B0B2FE|nr:MFS transporter [Rhizohabitans arisaemae]